MLRKSKARGSFRKASSYMTATYILDTSYSFETNLPTFRVRKGNNELNLMSQYQPSTPGKCHAVVVKLFLTFEVRLLEMLLCDYE